MRNRFSLLAAVVCAVGACTPPVKVDPEAARSSLRDTDSRYTKALIGKDRAGFLAAYAADAVMYPPGEATVTGLDAIGKVADTFWADPAFGGTFTPVSVEVSADGSMGYTLNAAALTVTGPNKKLATEQLRDFHVWRKTPDGTWKLVVDIWNAVPTAPVAASK